MSTRSRATVWLTAGLLLALSTGCGGGGDGGGGSGGGGGGLATGTFVRSVADAAGSTWNAPFFSGSVYQHVQHLVPADDIDGSGYLRALSLRLNTAVTATVRCPSFAIRMGHTTVSSLTPTFAANVEQGAGTAVTVRSAASFAIPPGNPGDYFKIDLDTPFYYNGKDNLVVEMIEEGAPTATVDLNRVTGVSGQALYSGSNGSLTGALYDAYLSMKFHFAGGDSTLEFGGAGGNSWPFSSQNPRVQMLYTAGEIDGSGPITGIGFQIDQTTTAAQTYLYGLRFAHTTMSALTATYANNFNSGSPVSVASGVFTVPANVPAGSYIWIPLTGSFTYDGTHNLIVDIVVTMGSGNTYLRCANTVAGRRASGPVLSTVATAVDTVTYHVKFRFHGGRLAVLPPLSGSDSSDQVLGSGQAGQLQTLYPSTVLGTSATIQNVYVRLASFASPTASQLTNYKLYMGHTTKGTLSLADSYASNMNENATVFDGPLMVPAGLKAGDWVKIPLRRAFSYDARKNLCILFTTDAGAVGNSVSVRFDGLQFPAHIVGRDDNAVTTSGLPSWDYSGMLDLAVDITK